MPPSEKHTLERYKSSHNCFSPFGYISTNPICPRHPGLNQKSSIGTPLSTLHGNFTLTRISRNRPQCVRWSQTTQAIGWTGVSLSLLLIMAMLVASQHSCSAIIALCLSACHGETGNIACAFAHSRNVIDE